MSCQPVVGGMSIPMQTHDLPPPLMWGRWLIIFNNYRRSIEAIFARSEKEVAHSHFVIIGFNGVG